MALIRPAAIRATLRRRQSGAALLIAMLVVTLVSTLAASMVWQQWRAVQVEAAERSRAQSTLILAGALDWARLLLREDARAGGSDRIGEPWSVPLEEVRISTFLAADVEHTDDAPEAFLSGRIVDAQSRYNLSNLVAAGEVVPAELAVLQRLFALLGVAADEADRIAAGLRAATSAPQSAAPASRPTAAVAAAERPLAPLRLDQLAWLGVAETTLQRIAPHVVLLPRPTPVNLNTASREVIAAAIEGLDLAGGERLVQLRQRTPFSSLADARQQLGPNFVLTEQRVGTSSSYFEVSGRLRLVDRLLEQTSLVERRQLEVLTIATDLHPRSAAP